MNIPTFGAVIRVRKGYKDAMDFELLKTEETTDYEEHRRRGLKHDV